MECGMSDSEVGRECDVRDSEEGKGVWREQGRNHVIKSG